MKKYAIAILLLAAIGWCLYFTYIKAHVREVIAPNYAEVWYACDRRIKAGEIPGLAELYTRDPRLVPGWQPETGTSAGECCRFFGDCRPCPSVLSAQQQPRLDDDILALNDAVEELECRWPEKASVVKLRFLAGLTMKQPAAALGFSLATAERHWRFARAWLHKRLKND